MLKKSILLSYLMEKADQMRRDDGKRVVSANYFMISLLKTRQEIAEGSCPEELKNEEVTKELEAIDRVLGEYRIDGGKMASRIFSDIHCSDYNSMMDEFVFNKIQYAAEAKMQSQGKEVLCAATLLEMVLAEPSDAIRKALQGEEELSDFDKMLAAMSEERDTKLTKSDRGAPASEEAPDTVRMLRSEKPAGSDAPAEPKGAARLSEVVQNTRKIQKMLLDNVFGQDQAVNSFVSGYFQGELMRTSRPEDKKPQATFLFAGPPGVGKTFLAETAAKALDLPFCRFDMSEYSHHEANQDFCGSNEMYKGSKEGNVTGFVSKNPHCVLLFDEIEKAHINIIYLFLQMLDAGRLRDNYTGEEVSFSQAIIILTTNVGKNLYEDPDIGNLSSLPRKKILKAISTDRDPHTNAPLFPAAICSRFASGNVVMFNHLDANNLQTIVARELNKNIKGFEESVGISIELDEKLATAIILSEGGKADARTLKGRSNAFFHEELYELFRLLGAQADAVEKLKSIRINVSLDECSEDIRNMFTAPSKPDVLVFADHAEASAYRKLLSDVTCHVTDRIDDAKEILFNHDVAVVLCDPRCGQKGRQKDLLNVDDVDSVGRDFLAYVLARHSIPVFLLQQEEGEITQEEFLSFAQTGVQDLLTVRTKKKSDFADAVLKKCEIAYQQATMFKLAKENKVLSYKTAQTVSRNRKVAEINLFGFRLSLATDTEDSKNILDNVSKPNLHFADVIGAQDAKEELEYFVNYMKNPMQFLRRGVRAPKGVLLYGPPGTGKTMLAKAMAGESDVTFMTAEGNQFLKRYVGEGPEAVHDLFRAARKYAPTILFIDEIDAIGKDRNSTGNNDNTGDVLTAFLTEMDGFNTDTSKPVFVLAATNYSVEPGQGKSLDAALIRRFDRKIYVDLPNKEERRRFLEMKLARHSSVVLSEEQINNIAMRSTGMSLAELDLIFEMALRSAIRSESGVVGDEAFEEAFETFNSGEKKEWNPESLQRTARHEAGHALLCWLGGEKPSYLTIVARGDHGGYMQHANSEGKGLYTRSELLHKIRTSLAGRAAELVYYGAEEGISTGASGDLHSATSIAEQMICHYGMDDSVGLSYLDGNATDPTYMMTVRGRVNEMLREEMKNAIDLIRTNREAMDRMVDTLMEKNHLKEDEIDKIFSTYTVTAPKA